MKSRMRSSYSSFYTLSLILSNILESKISFATLNWIEKFSSTFYLHWKLFYVNQIFQWDVFLLIKNQIPSWLCRTLGHSDSFPQQQIQYIMNIMLWKTHERDISPRNCLWFEHVWVCTLLFLNFSPLSLKFPKTTVKCRKVKSNP